MEVNEFQKSSRAPVDEEPFLDVVAQDEDRNDQSISSEDEITQLRAQLEALRYENEASRRREQALTRKLNLADGTYFDVSWELWLEQNSVEFDGATEEFQGILRERESPMWFTVVNEKQKPNKEFPEEGLFPGTKQGEERNTSMAHLVPLDRSCSIFYGQAFCLIAKVKEPMEKNCIDSPFLRHLIEGSGAHSPSGRVVGVKTLCTNFLKLPHDHAHFFDHMDKGKLVIVPIWTPELNKWKVGDSYSLLVVADSSSVYQWLGLKDMDDLPWLKEADDADLECATEKLALMMRVLAEQLISEDFQRFIEKAKEVSTVDELMTHFVGNGSVTSTTLGTGKSNSGSTKNTAERDKKRNTKAEAKLDEFKRKLGSLIQVRDTLQESKRVNVPKFAIDLPEKKRRLLKVDLGEYSRKHPNSIPDPLLVLLRAAINCSDMFGSKLLPACLLVDDKADADEDDGEDSKSLSSIEDIYVWRGDDDDISVLSNESIESLPSEGSIVSLSSYNREVTMPNVVTP